MTWAPVTVWDLDLTCGTTVRREYQSAYPGVRVYGCPCGSPLPCSVEYRRIVVDNTARRSDHREIKVCDTCAVVIANGDTSGEGGEESADAIERRWAGYHLILACSEDGCEGFAWAPCDVCGAEGGTLHPAVAEPIE